MNVIEELKLFNFDLILQIIPFSKISTHPEIVDTALIYEKINIF